MSYLDLEHKKVKTASKIMLPSSDKLNKKILNTISTITKLVGATLGPNGRPVIMERAEPGLMPFLSKDGVTVARSLAFSDPIQQAILEIYRDIAIKTVEFAGDGTTTATILGSAIYENIKKFLLANKKLSPQVCIRQIAEFFDKQCLPYINSKSAKINLNNKNDLLFKVANISSNGDVELSKTILSAFEQVGDEGHITISELCGPKGFAVEKIDGLPIAKGYEESLGRFSNEFVNDNSQNRVYLENPYIILYDGKLHDLGLLNNFIELFAQDFIQKKAISANFVIFAHEFSKELVAKLAEIFKNTGPLNIVCCLTPNDIIANARTEFLKDVAAFTGGKIFNPLTDSLVNCVLTDLGMPVKAFEMQRFRSCIMGQGNQDSVIARVEELKERLANSVSKTDAYDLNLRIGKISGGIAKLIIKDIADSQIRETKDRAEDAICAIRGAIKSGVLPGGCRILIDLAVLAAKSEHAVVRDVLQRAFLEPHLWLLKNCGLNVDEIKVIVERLLDDSNIVYDALNEVYGNAIDLGLLDSQPAVTGAIQSAIAIATVLGSNGGIVVFGRDDELERKEALEYANEMDRISVAEAEDKIDQENAKYDINTF